MSNILQQWKFNRFAHRCFTCRLPIWLLIICLQLILGALLYSPVLAYQDGDDPYPFPQTPQASASMHCLEEITTGFPQESSSAGETPPAFTRLCASALSENIRPADNISLRWEWDASAYITAANSDACALFDSGGDGTVDSALCVAIDPSPPGSPPLLQDARYYACSGEPDRCFSTGEQSFSGACSLGSLDTRPISDHQEDANRTLAAAVECQLPASTLGLEQPGLVLVGLCTFAPESSISSPSNCRLSPGFASWLALDTASGSTYLASSDFASLTDLTANPETSQPSFLEMLALTTLGAVIIVGILNLFRLRRQTNQMKKS